MPLGAGDEQIGEIVCGPKSEGVIQEDEIQLIRTLAGQVGLALMNARLAGRIVNAAESERRRIERNIHDGAQQELVALVAKLGMARSAADGGGLSVNEIDDLRLEAQQILSDLRELAQGIHPSVLSDGGILEAVEERCARLPLHVSLEHSEGLRAQRFDDEIEGAAYFFVSESLTNVLKHAHATRVIVSLTHADGRLRLEVSDDGRGFEPVTARQNGLAGLRDRIRALGGTVTVASRPGERNAHFGHTAGRSVVRVVIAEDHYLVREGTRRLLESSGEVDVVAAVESAETLLTAVDRLQPDAVITDIRMPPTNQMEGIEVAHVIRSEYPQYRGRGPLPVCQLAVRLRALPRRNSPARLPAQGPRW